MIVRIQDVYLMAIIQHHGPRLVHLSDFANVNKFTCQYHVEGESYFPSVPAVSSPSLNMAYGIPGCIRDLNPIRTEIGYPELVEFVGVQRLGAKKQTVRFAPSFPLQQQFATG